MKSKIYKLLHLPRMLQAPFHLDEIGWMFHHSSTCSKCLDRPFICIGYNYDKYDSSSNIHQASLSCLSPGVHVTGAGRMKDEIFFSFSSEDTEKIWNFFNIDNIRGKKFMFTLEIIQVRNMIQERLEHLSMPGVCDELDMLAILLITLCLKQARNSEKSEAPLDYKIFEIAGGLKKGENLTSLLKKHSMGRRTFYEYWKKYYSISPIQYKLEENLLEARLLLEQTSLPIREIAESCSFSSLVYFSLCFRKYIGVSPRAYRRNFQKPKDKQDEV